MSFFNVFSQEPSLVILGMQTRPDGTVKEAAGYGAPKTTS